MYNITELHSNTFTAKRGKRKKASKKFENGILVKKCAKHKAIYDKRLKDQISLVYSRPTGTLTVFKIGRQDI